MTNWKRLYTDASMMLDKYQNDVVPNLRKQLENRVEVVRCKDCKAYDKEVGYCDAMGFMCVPDDFCSYGERRNDET